MPVAYQLDAADRTPDGQWILAECWARAMQPGTVVSVVLPGQHRPVRAAVTGRDHTGATLTILTPETP